METLKIFGQRLRTLREEKHLRQADMAQHSLKLRQSPISCFSGGDKYRGQIFPSAEQHFAYFKIR